MYFIFPQDFKQDKMPIEEMQRKKKRLMFLRLFRFPCSISFKGFEGNFYCYLQQSDSYILVIVFSIPA